LEEKVGEMGLEHVISSWSLVAPERHGISKEWGHEGRERGKTKIRLNTKNAKIRVDQVKNLGPLRLGISWPWA